MNKSSLPVSFKLPRDNNKVGLEAWLIANNLVERITYEWHTSILVFENEEDAVAFYLKFGIPRYETKIDEMLKNEKSNN